MADFNYGTMVPYLFFKKANNNCVTVRADKLLMIRKKAATKLSLIFEGSGINNAGLNKLGTVAVPDAWYTTGNIEVIVDCATGKGDEACKAIVRAINLPVSVGDPRSTYDRGFIVIADAVAGTYIDPLIDDVDSINIDTRATADLAGDDITA